MQFSAQVLAEAKRAPRVHVDEVVWCILETVLCCAGVSGSEARAIALRKMHVVVCPPLRGAGPVRKPASTRVHIDEKVWCILETVLWSLDTQILVGCEVVPLQYCGAQAPSDKVARSSGVRSTVPDYLV